jgi:EAL domain-containing protein (putative c-di-GMP-specific phosphodiesterase class I)
VIKIDKSLVDDAEKSRKRRIMLEHVIAMSHELSLEVVCEGVETADQVEMLRRMGCDIIQGYYFSPPLSYEAYCAYLKQ